MLKQNARIIEVHNGQVVLEISKRLGCSGCHQQGCSAQGLSALFGSQKSVISLCNTLDLHMGDEVVIGISETDLLKSAALVYLLPVLAMLFAAGVAQSIFGDSHDIAQILAAILGFSVTLWWTKKRLHALSSTRQPIEILHRKLSR